jgi:Flp pilus assembly CpaF family ATPase
VVNEYETSSIFKQLQPLGIRGIGGRGGDILHPLLDETGEDPPDVSSTSSTCPLLDKILEPLLEDPTVNDILVNSFQKVYVERHGVLERSTVRFRDERHLLRIIDKIVSRVGRRVDESQPWVDARLEDGSRVNVIIRPCAIDGPSLSIRKFARKPLTLDRLVETGALTQGASHVLQAFVDARLNVLISGGTGSGKTTMLNAMSAFIDRRQRVVTIEDAAELQLQQDHVVRLETRPANAEGGGAVTQRDLVRNALRMRPDRIIVGEVRGAEAFDMLQAMNTGHDGSMTTIHANSSRDALGRLEQMVSMAGFDFPLRAVRQQIAAGIQIVLQLSRLSDGRRRIVSISEVTGMEGDVITMQEIYDRRSSSVTACLVGLGYISRSSARSERARFGEQLPDAIDVMVRSPAGPGHPDAASRWRWWRRRCPIPRGSEFGMAADETHLRIGPSQRRWTTLYRARRARTDLMLVVVALSIQSGDGRQPVGNPLQPLQGHKRSATRCAARSGRSPRKGAISGWALSSPCCRSSSSACLNLLVTEPTTGTSGDIPIASSLSSSPAVVLMLIGYFIMYRMVNFRF